MLIEKSEVNLKKLKFAKHIYCLPEVNSQFHLQLCISTVQRGQTPPTQRPDTKEMNSSMFLYSHEKLFTAAYTVIEGWLVVRRGQGH